MPGNAAMTLLQHDASVSYVGESPREEIECIFCLQRSHDIVIDEGGYQCRKCPSCNLIYLSPRPTLTEVGKLYESNRANQSAEASILGFFSRRLHEKYHLRIIKRFIEKGSLLEIGPGAGAFLYEARKEGFQVCGIELNSIQANFIRNRLGISCEESVLDGSSFGGGKFDIIYHRDVISHFYDPIAELKKMNEKLRENGFLIFETGNLGDVEEKYFKLFPSFQLPDHLFFFGEENLKELLRRTGFEFVETHRYSIVPLLWIMKTLKKAMDRLLPQMGKKALSKNPLSLSKANRFKWVLRNGFNYFSYMMLYKIGAMLPKKGRPQSLIIVARKRG